MAGTRHTAYNIRDMGDFAVKDMPFEKSKELFDYCDCTSAEALAEGYIEMSRINLELAEESVLSDNEALELCEQKFAECE